MANDPKLNPAIDWAYLGEDFSPLQEVARCEDAAKTAERTRAEIAWAINLKWAIGEPYYRQDPDGHIEWVTPDDQRRYFHVNIIHPRVMTLIGNELYVPKFEARPKASGQAEDMMRARASADVVNHAVHVSEMYHELSKAHYLKHVCGQPWLEVGFDKEAGEIGPAYGSAPCPVCGGTGAVSINPNVPGLVPCHNCGAQGVVLGRPDLAPLPPGQVYQVIGEEPEGDVAVTCHPPWEILQDPDHDAFKIRYLTHVKDIDKKVFFEQFAKDTNLTPDDIPDSVVGANHLFSRLPGWDRNSTGRKGLVTLKRFFHLPTLKHPQGIYIVIAGENVVVSAGKLPYAHRKIPFVPLRCHDIPGIKAYPKSTVDSIMAEACAINEMLTKMYERAEQSVQMRILAARGHAMDVGDVQGLYEFDYRPSTPEPKFWNDTGASPDAANMVDRLFNYADESSFSADVMRGQSSGSEDNARLMAYREQRAVVPLKRMLEDNAKSYAEIGRLLHDTIKLCYGPHRVIRSVYGAHGHYKYRAFGTTKLGTTSDFELIPTRDIGRTLASRRQEIMEASKSGVFASPEALKLSEFSTEVDIYGDKNLHENAALTENEEARSGRPMGPPAKYEGHDIHIPSHKAVLAELRVTLGKDHPSCFDLEQHIDMHEQLKVQEQMELQFMQQQAMMGMQEQASQFGTANAADASSQPSGAVDAVQAAQSGVVTQGDPSGFEQQPGLQQVDQQLRSEQ